MVVVDEEKVLVGEEIFSFDINAFLMEQTFLEGI